jgi:CDP-paratose 2-epimerase
LHAIVTGGAGFIGSNVAARLLRDGYQVTLLDSLARPGSERNLAWLQRQPGHAGLRFVRGDTRDADLVRRTVGAADVQLVFHLAAQTAVTTSVVDPRADLEINVLGTHNVLEALRASTAPIPPLLFYTSTNKVYGALRQRGVREERTRYRFADPELDAHGVSEAEPLDFHSPYGCSKGAADQYVRDYARIYNLRTVVFRMSCIYGPRQFGNEDQGWVAHFTRAVAAGRPLTIYGNGKQVRDLLYVDDLIRAFELAAQHAERAVGRVYNIGGGMANSISIWEELRPRLEKITGRRISASLDGWRPGDQPVYVSDTRQALRDFGWRPEVCIDDGLERLWAWAQTLEDARAESRDEAREGARLRAVPLARPGLAPVRPSA